MEEQVPYQQSVPSSDDQLSPIRFERKVINAKEINRLVGRKHIPFSVKGAAHRELLPASSGHRDSGGQPRAAPRRGAPSAGRSTHGPARYTGCASRAKGQNGPQEAPLHRTPAPRGPGHRTAAPDSGHCARGGPGAASTSCPGPPPREDRPCPAPLPARPGAQARPPRAGRSRCPRAAHHCSALSRQVSAVRIPRPDVYTRPPLPRATRMRPGSHRTAGTAGGALQRGRGALAQERRREGRHVT